MVVEVKGRKEQVGCADPTLAEPMARPGAVRIVQEACGNTCEFNLQLCVNRADAVCKATRIDQLDVLGDDGELSMPELPAAGLACGEHLDPVRLELGPKEHQTKRVLKLTAYRLGKGRHPKRRIRDHDVVKLVCRRSPSPEQCCGDGIPQGAERCDDGNRVNGDDCDNNCMPGCPSCITAGSETCDDGNRNNFDGCDENCTKQSCGNGIRALDQYGNYEDCDPGASTNACEGGSVCDSSCKCTSEATCQCVDGAGMYLPRDNVLTLRVGPKGIKRCGFTSDVTGNPVGDLDCGEVYVGGGRRFPEHLIVPVDATVTATATCNGGAITISPGGGTAKGCTEPGCLFAAPIQVTVDYCIVISFATGLIGTIQCNDLSMDIKMPLQAEIFYKKCPTCSTGLARECSPAEGTASLGILQLQDFALATATDGIRETETSGQFATYCYDKEDGCFAGDLNTPGCPGPANGVPRPCSETLPCQSPFTECRQRSSGAFASPAVRMIQLTGIAPSKLGNGEEDVARLVGLFDVPPSFAKLIDAHSDLPGPGAVGINTVVRLQPASAAPAP